MNTSKKHAVLSEVEAGYLFHELTPFVRSIAWATYRHMPTELISVLDYEDLESVGLTTLAVILPRYRKSEAAATTFVAPRVRGAMWDEIYRMDRLPRSLRSKLADAHDGAKTTYNGRAYRTLLESGGYQLVSLQTPLDEGDERTLGDCLVDETSISILGEMCRRDREALVARAIRRLSKRHQRIVELYYYDELNLEDVGLEMGTTKPAIWHTLRLIKEKLKASLLYFRVHDA